MTRRTRGREIALQVLYQLEQNPEMEPDAIRAFLEGRLRDPSLRDYAESLVEGVRSHQKKLDDLIGRVAENWSVDRMAAIDRNILRLGAFEMLHRGEIPIKVVITEALELAKRYSTSQSSRFVNGILDRLQGPATEARSGTPPPEFADDSSPGRTPDESPPPPDAGSR